MPRSTNAKVAAAAFRTMVDDLGYDKGTAWKAIARQLLTCKVWGLGGWHPFKGVIVYRESNDFIEGSAVLKRAEKLTEYIAVELGVQRTELCDAIGRYWELPDVRNLQPHNLVGHAFRSMLVEALEKFGDPGISYEEEVDPHNEFPGHSFVTRSKNPRIDIVARRGPSTVAIISSRWRFRHDRVDLIDEALAYASPARRTNPSCKTYAWIGEFSPSRLEKVLNHCPPTSNPAISAAVHFNPKLITDALGENGRTKELKSLEWMIDQSFNWR